MNLVTVRVPVRLENEIEVFPIVIDFTGRKNLTNTKFYENGQFHYVNNWDREDGKIDYYPDIIKEAIENGFNE